MRLYASARDYFLRLSSSAGKSTAWFTCAYCNLASPTNFTGHATIDALIPCPFIYIQLFNNKVSRPRRDCNSLPHPADSALRCQHLQSHTRDVRSPVTARLTLFHSAATGFLGNSVASSHRDHKMRRLSSSHEGSICRQQSMTPTAKRSSR